MACNELIEEDLEDHKVEIVAPKDNTETIHQTILFAWEEVEYGKNYHIQVATPNFNNAQTLLIDSIISFPDTIQVKTSLKYELFPGDFQWRVRSFNGGSTTPYATATFRIVDTTTTVTSPTGEGRYD
jgi:hypothetical protein